MVVGFEGISFAALTTVPDRGCCVDDVAYGKAATFFEFSVVNGVHLKHGDVHLPEIRIFSARSVQVQSAQGESGFLCVMAGVFDCDGRGGLHGTLLSRKMNETETKDLEKVFQKTVLSYFYHNTSFPASFFEKSNEDSCPMFSLLRQRFFL